MCLGLCFLMLILGEQLTDEWKTLLDVYYCMWDDAFLIVPLTASYNFNSGTAL